MLHVRTCTKGSASVHAQIHNAPMDSPSNGQNTYVGKTPQIRQAGWVGMLGMPLVKIYISM